VSQVNFRGENDPSEKLGGKPDFVHHKITKTSKKKIDIQVLENQIFELSNEDIKEYGNHPNSIRI
jgi:hypothetical protein